MNAQPIQLALNRNNPADAWYIQQVSRMYFDAAIADAYAKYVQTGVIPHGRGRPGFEGALAKMISDNK